MADTKIRGELSPDKIQVCWRISTKVLTALKNDADRQGFSSIPLYLNHLLTSHYFGNRKFKWNGEWIDAVDSRYRGIIADKKQVNWRIMRRVVYALQADADQWEMSVPNLLNAMLTFHYFGDKENRKS